jgi:hypothetical protein
MSQERESEKGRGSPEPGAKAPRPRRHRTYGYRGYGSGFDRGTGHVHWGSGFGGVGPPSYGGGTLPSASGPLGVGLDDVPIYALCIQVVGHRDHDHCDENDPQRVHRRTPFPGDEPPFTHP